MHEQDQFNMFIVPWSTSIYVIFAFSMAGPENGLNADTTDFIALTVIMGLTPLVLMAAWTGLSVLHASELLMYRIVYRLHVEGADEIPMEDREMNLIFNCVKIS